MWVDLETFDSLTSEERKARQLQCLKEILQYSYENVTFYRKRFDECGFNPYSMNSFKDIDVVPILEKNDAVEAGRSIYSTEKGLESYSTFTGGSSGQALRVLCEKKSIYRERAFACHTYAKYGFDPLKSRTAAFWGHNKDADYYYSPLKNEIVISPFRLYKEGSAQGIVRDIADFGAEYLAGYPSAIFQLVQMMELEGLSLPKVKHVFYYAENYELDKKVYVEKVLACGSSSNYGHTEHAVFADITDENCIFNDLYGYTELVQTDLPGEYRIVCTGFTNRAMPLIRYATDDVVVVGEDGSRKLIGHKCSDVFLVGKNGAKIFKGAMTLHIEELKKIKAYQYHQSEPGRAELHIVEIESLSREEKDRIYSYLAKRTEGLLDVSIVTQGKIVMTTRGKSVWAVVDSGLN